MDILIQLLNRALKVAPGANLLEALREAQVPVSYACMAGRCGICRCKVTAGRVLEGSGEQQCPHAGTAPYALDCQSYLTEPCTIEIPGPDQVEVRPARLIKATVRAMEDLTRDIQAAGAAAGQAAGVFGGAPCAASVHA